MSDSAKAPIQTPEWAALYAELDGYVDSLDIRRNDPERKGHLIQVLHKAQGIFGYLPMELQRHVAQRLFLQDAEVSGVVSFYNYFTTTPKGKYNINICMGTACYVRGAQKVLEGFEKELGVKAGIGVTADKLFSITALRCIGACSLAPVVMINEKVHGRVAIEDVRKIINECLKEEQAG
jgi:NADH:ubiquinone oxidoreductase subunit E